ncbi:glycosyltransferase family 2 protein [Xenorhabdus sp. Reich]|uniref:Glycosyltransferase family 2 protein n=2 Tax=Xenorhabdus littoralis TaxID=2582835 RepID=A0ABU4SGE7_9GAMM|nr:glycosyltransferase family 2 protein [Xenorhabdus sp. Reich]
MASIPTRKEALFLSVSSIYSQVNELNIYLNGYNEIPVFLNRRKINIYVSSQFGDFGDASKFYPLKNKKGYLFTLDDDLIYPPDYIKKLIYKVEKYKRKSFICVHGNIIDKSSLLSYYKNKKGIHFSKSLDEDTIVNIPGTGTLAYHSSLHSFSMKSFPIKNMSDIWVAVIAKQKKIPIICIDRENYWVRNAITTQDSHSIYSNRKNLDQKISEIIKNKELYKL